MCGRTFSLLGLSLSVLIAIVALGQRDAQAQGSVDASTVVVAVASADDTDDAAIKPAIKGSDKKGKYWFKKSCKSCHGKDGDGGEITPISKTIKQWERYFRKDKHTGEEMLGATFDAEQLIHIQTFLINHAADSDQPETCG